MDRSEFLKRLLVAPIVAVVGSKQVLAKQIPGDSVVSPLLLIEDGRLPSQFGVTVCDPDGLATALHVRKKVGSDRWDMWNTIDGHPMDGATYWQDQPITKDGALSRVEFRMDYTTPHSDSCCHHVISPGVSRMDIEGIGVVSAVADKDTKAVKFNIVRDDPLMLRVTPT